jgi:hypothetical protein
LIPQQHHLMPPLLPGKRRSLIKLGHSFIIILMQLPSNLARNFDRMLRQIPDRK